VESQPRNVTPIPGGITNSGMENSQWGDTTQSETAVNGNAQLTNLSQKKVQKSFFPNPFELNEAPKPNPFKSHNVYEIVKIDPGVDYPFNPD